MWRRIMTGVVLTPWFLSTGGLAQEPSPANKSVPEQVVDAFNGVFGVHPGARAVHAKGIVLEGKFTPSSSAPSVSKAAHFQKKKSPIPVTVRFSASTGLPAIPDTDPGASPRGMAVKFRLPDGSTTDIVAHSFNGFPVATASELRDLFLAIAATKPANPPPTPLDRFLNAHPAAKAFVEASKPEPISYATLGYFGVNTFKFTNAKGTVTFGRYQLQPFAGEHFISKEQLTGPNYLAAEIRERVVRGPAKFRLLVQVAEKHDTLDNPTVVWPEIRKKIDLGTIDVTTAVEDSRAAERTLLFTPGAVITGIEAADPMIQARAAAYVVSLSRRAQQPE